MATEIEASVNHIGRLTEYLQQHKLAPPSFDVLNRVTTATAVVPNPETTTMAATIANPDLRHLPGD